jgi:hypothetical protein
MELDSRELDLLEPDMYCSCVRKEAGQSLFMMYFHHYIGSDDYVVFVSMVVAG